MLILFSIIGTINQPKLVSGFALMVLNTLFLLLTINLVMAVGVKGRKFSRKHHLWENTHTQVKYIDLILSKYCSLLLFLGRWRCTFLYSFS